MDLLQWMGAVSRVQMADKKPHDNPYDSNLSVNILWSENKYYNIWTQNYETFMDISHLFIDEATINDF